MPPENEIRSVESKRAFIEGYLWKQDDYIFFAGGACHIFALELHRKYGYPLRIIEKEDGRITHVYCIRYGEPFDVRAGKVESKYFFEQYPGISQDTTENKLVSFFTGDNWDGIEHGLWGEPEFVIKATERAKRWAEKPEYAPHEKLG